MTENRVDDIADFRSGIATEKLIFAVKEGNEYQALAAVREQVKQGLNDRLGDEVSEWKYYLVRVLTLLTYVPDGSFMANRYFDAIAGKYLQKIHQAVNVKELHLLLEEIVLQYCKVNHKEIKTHSPLVQRIIVEVATDLTEPLTLQYFADKFSVNGSYLSNLFRKETGVTITDYVTSQRINHAAHLLRHTQEPIKTIAKQVGIADVQYFSRLFKRKMEMTPSKYRGNED